MHLLRFYDVGRQQGLLFRSTVLVDGGSNSALFGGRVLVGLYLFLLGLRHL